MPSDATIGHGLQFQRGDGAESEVFTTVAEVTNLSGPGMSRDTVDVTHMGTPDAFREFIAGLADPGEITLDVNFLPADSSHGDMLNDFNNRVVRNYRLIWPHTGNPQWQITGVMTGFETTAPIDDKISATFTIKVTERPVFN